MRRIFCCGLLLLVMVCSNVKRTNYKPLAVKDAIVVLNGIRPGRWTVEYFDSHAGKVTRNITKNVGADGRCVIDLPETVWDAAFRPQRQHRYRPQQAAILQKSDISA